VSVERGDMNLAPEAGGVAKHERKIYFNADTGVWEIHPFPGCYVIPYSLTVWSAYRATDNYVREWILGQLGPQGLAESELLLPVLHKSPWGQMLQPFKFTGMSDNSDLEGDSARMIRTTYTFDLRAWLLKLPVVGTPPVLFPENDTQVWQGTDYPARPTASHNLFRQPFREDQLPAAWPSTGRGSFEIDPEEIPGPNGHNVTGYLVTVGTEADSVPLFDTPTSLDAMGVAIVEVSFTYRTRSWYNPVTLELAQKSESAINLCREVELPARIMSTRVQVYTVTSGHVFMASIVGRAGNALQAMNVWDVCARHLLTLDTLAPSTTIDLGPGIGYAWRSLLRRPYLAVGLLYPATGGPATVRAENDADAASFSRTQEVDPTANVGFAILIQPETDSVRLIVPKTLRLSSVWLSSYGGEYVGHEI
jgi:hypothetical protein